MPRIRNVGGVRPQPFFVRASCLKHSNEWKRHGHYKCSERNRALGFVFSTQSSVYGTITVANVSLFSTWTRSTVSFYSVSIEINPFRCEQTSVI